MRKKLSMWKWVALLSVGVLAYTQKDWIMEQFDKIKGNTTD
jgi:hypothetical protein